MAIKSTDLPPRVLAQINRPKTRNARGARKPGRMNKTEEAYRREVLENRKLAREISWYAFEPIKLRLADRTYYTPDFLVMLADGTLEVHEVKGFWEDDARVKIKVANEMFPFRFVAISKQAKKYGGGWSYEHIGRKENSNVSNSN